jgi:uncharacterized protein YcbX
MAAITVTGLALAPVKGMRLCEVAEITLDGRGAVGDRAFLVVDHDNELLLTSRTPALTRIRSAWDAAAGRLRLSFHDGSEVADVPEPGAAATTRGYDGREVRGHLVDGPLAQALSEQLGRPVRLLQRDATERGADDFPVTLMSEASLEALAPALSSVPDARRFRMTIRIDGVAAWEEHGWTGREVAVGDAVLRVDDPVPRCVVTTRDPDSGERDLPVLNALADLRGKRDVTFGVWCDVAQPGRIRRGDAIVPA